MPRCLCFLGSCLVQTSSLVDELLGEVQGLKSQVSDLDGSLGEMGEKVRVTPH